MERKGRKGRGSWKNIYQPPKLIPASSEYREELENYLGKKGT